VKFRANALLLAIQISSFCFLIFTTACKKEYFAVSAFQPIVLPVTQNIADLVFSDSLHGFACGGQIWGNGYILETYDGGLSWQKVFDTDSYLEAIDLTPDQTLAVTCGMGGTICYRDGPQGDWQKKAGTNNTIWYRNVAITPSGNRALLVSGVSFGNGVVTQLVPFDSIYTCPNELTDIASINENTQIVIGYGYVVRTTDAGQNWTRLPLQNAFFTAIDFLDPQHGLIATEAGDIYRSTDAGATWQHQCKLGKNPKITDIAWASTEVAYACGTSGTIFKTIDGGASWSAARDVPQQPWLTIKPLGAKVLVAGQSGQMLLLEL
jgi:photosystem II stability/assembly factor-like uncharacterized protein